MKTKELIEKNIKWIALFICLILYSIEHLNNKFAY